MLRSLSLPFLSKHFISIRGAREHEEEKGEEGK
jgi:hypothetical protein